MDISSPRFYSVKGIDDVDTNACNFEFLEKSIGGCQMQRLLWNYGIVVGIRIRTKGSLGFGD